MLLQNKRIAIVGGGPGGLTLARLLQIKGADVQVYERDIDRNVRLQGGALDLHTESGLAALEKAGLMEKFKAAYRPGAEKTRVVDSQAKIFYDQHIEHTATGFGDKNHRPEIDRGPLRDILLDSLQPGTVVWNSHILSIRSIGITWEIIFQNGNTVIADMVIGADGSNSKIRPFVTAIKPVWAGVTMIEGAVYDSQRTAPEIQKLLKGGKIFAYGNEKTVIVSAKGDGNFGFTISLKTEESWISESGIDFSDNKQLLAWFKKEFTEWDSIWDELFSSEKSLFIPRPQYCMPLDQSWEAKPNLTLIGDAAHWMPPFAGEGVNMAMLDALELSEHLTSGVFPDMQTAIKAYEQPMFKRFAKVGLMTMFNTKWMHQPNAIENMLAMFSPNIFKQARFIGKMWMATWFAPLFRKKFNFVFRHEKH